MSKTTNKMAEEIATVKASFAAGLIPEAQAVDRINKIRARYDLGTESDDDDTEPPTTAQRAVKAAAPPQPRKSALAAMTEEETTNEGEKIEPVTPWEIMELPAPLTKEGRIDRSNLNVINLRPVEAGERKDVKDPKTGEKKKVWVGEGLPSGVIAMDAGSQWKALYLTPKQMQQYINAFNARNPETGELYVQEALNRLLATSQPQKIDIL